MSATGERRQPPPPAPFAKREGGASGTSVRGLVSVEGGTSVPLAPASLVAKGAGGVGCLLALLVSASFAQDRRPSLTDVPPVDRAREHFYGAVAAGDVRVSWSADPTAAPQGSDVTLSLTVHGAANPTELRKPDLRKLPRFGDRFQVIDRPDPAPPPGATEVRFTYTLRPRQAGGVEVPALRYAYYRPGLPEGRRFQTAYAEPLALTVTPPPPTAVPPPVPLDSPEEFFHLAGGSTTPDVPMWAWAVPPLLVPVAVGGWVLVWRRLFPDAARRAKLRRTRAVRAALHRLKRARTAPDPAAEVTAAVRDYLTGRFNLPTAAQTPTEVAAALRAAGHPEPLAEAAAGFLAACDARFAPAGDNGLSLAEQAERFVTATEGQA